MPEKCLPHASQLSDLSELSVSLAGASQHSCCNARISKAPMCQVPNLWAASCALHELHELQEASGLGFTLVEPWLGRSSELPLVELISCHLPSFFNPKKNPGIAGAFEALGLLGF